MENVGYGRTEGKENYGIETDGKKKGCRGGRVRMV